MQTKEINKAGVWSSNWSDVLINASKEENASNDVGEKLVLETDKFKVWSIRLASGKSLPFHKHNKPYFYTIKGEGKSRSYYADGKITETTYKENDTANFSDLSEENYFIHNLVNVGKTELIFTTVEYK